MMTDIYKPIQTEYNRVELKLVEGFIPSALKGTFYRNGPNPKFEPLKNYHLFDGAGMIHAFEFSNGKVFYKNKWVKTSKFQIESKFQQSVFGGILDFRGNKISFAQINKAYNASNTNLIWFNHQLISLWEFGEPYEIDPMTLETIGPANYIVDQQVGAFTAHPKIDSQTNEMLSVSYNGCLDLPSCYMNIFDKNGHSVGKSIDLPYRTMIHDFTFTKNYMIVPILPAQLDFSSSSRAMIDWNPKAKSSIAIYSRQFPYELIHSFEIPLCYIYHFFNSYELNDNKIIVDAIIHDIAPLFSRDENHDLIEPKYGKFLRWTFHIKENFFIEKIIDDSAFYHFPHCPVKKLGQEYPTAFSYSQEGDIHQLRKINLINHNPEIEIYSSPPSYYLSEPYFVSASDALNEEEGYILAIRTSFDKNKSHLLIFNANSIVDPVAIIALPERIPLGFHGLWVSD